MRACLDWRCGAGFILWLTLSSMTLAATDPSTEDPEQTVCGWFKERLAFAAWSAVAGAPNPQAWRGVQGAAPISFKTRDGRALAGYKISAKPAPPGAAGHSGFLLVAQGNAMLADQLLPELSAFAERGVDVFIYDYRGYGASEGKPRLQAIVGDYREIFQAHSASGYERKLLYGISFGGVVMLNVIGRGIQFNKAVIDSAPSRVSNLGCPAEYDPVGKLPVDSSSLLIISGLQDTVVRPGEMRELLEVARTRGAKTLAAEQFAHPFMDADAAVHGQRQKIVQEHLFD